MGYTGTTGHLSFTWNTGGFTWGSINNLNIATSTWSFVAVSITPTGATGLVCTLSGSCTSDTLSITNSPLTSPAPFHIGTDFAGREFVGHIDDVRIYDRALSRAELMALYASGSAKIGTTGGGPNAPLSNGLVGHWTFDGGVTNWATGKTNDVSGNGNTGQLIAMSTSTSPTFGKIGQGIKFNGSNQHINMGDVLDLTGSSMSVSVWIKRFSDYSGCGGCAAGVIGKFDTSGANNDSYVVEVINNAQGNPSFMNKVVFTTLKGLTNDYAYSNSTIKNNVWYHVVVTYNGSSKDIYINGRLDSQTPATGSITAVTAPLQIGYTLGWFNSGGYFNGLIDEPRLYDRALSPQEVQQLYLMGK
jgi:hypothetical protein